MITFPRNNDNLNRMTVQDLEYIDPNLIRKYSTLLSDTKNPYFEPIANDLAKTLAKSGVNYEQLEILIENIKGVKNINWKHYLMFLLYPSDFPIKVRPPGIMPLPTGTEIRQIRDYRSVTISADNNIFKLRYDPLMAGGSLEYAYYSQGLYAAGTSLTNATLFPANWGTVFTAHRLIAAECRIQVIQSLEESRGRIITSPSGISSGAITEAEFNGTTVGNIWDNQFVVEGEAIDGCRMIFLPAEEKNLNFARMTDDWSTAAQPGYTRLIWDCIIRGLKAGATIELFFTFYFEGIVSDDYMELVSSPDSNCRPNTKGNISDVINTGGDILKSNLPDIINTRPPAKRNGGFGDLLDTIGGITTTASNYLTKIMQIGKTVGPLVGNVLSTFGSASKLLPLIL